MDILGCQRCIRIGTECVYSRSGVLRRTRKRKAKSTSSEPLELEDPFDRSRNRRRHSIASAANDTRVGGRGVQSFLDADIEETRRHLRGIDTTPEQHLSLDALSSLLEVCGGGDSLREAEASVAPLPSWFYLFEEHAAEWAQSWHFRSGSESQI